MSEVRVEGGCLCGEVRWAATAEPLNSTICHCEYCRRACGAQSVAWLTFPGESFSFIKGEAAVYRSSPPVRRTFCGRCGTSLAYEHDDRAEIDVTTGSADDPGAFPSTYHHLVEEKIPWVKTD